MDLPSGKLTELRTGKWTIFLDDLPLQHNEDNPIYLVGGWALPLWKIMEFISWDDDIPNWMEIHKIHVPNHQPAIITI